MNARHRKLQIATALSSLVACLCVSAAEGERIMMKPELRSATERQLLVSVAFGGLTARTNPTALSGMLGPGLISVLSQDDAQSKANSRVAPIAKALGEYDFKGKAMKYSLEFIQSVDWLPVSTSSYVENGAATGYKALATSNPSAGFVLVDYNFWMEPRLDAIKVRAVAQIMASESAAASASGSKSPSKHVAQKPIYFQQFICFVPVKGFGADRLVNADLWSAKEGEQVRAALDRALSKLSSLMAQGIVFTDAQNGEVNKLKAFRVGYSPKTAENYYGKLVEKDESGTLIQSQFGEWIYYFWPTVGG